MNQFEICTFQDQRSNIVSPMYVLDKISQPTHDEEENTLLRSLTDGMMYHQPEEEGETVETDDFHTVFRSV